ncbi:MAG: hypothetical protein U9P44_00230 [archaeon]|nr:hypothetical protein [archaeon]
MSKIIDNFRQEIFRKSIYLFSVLIVVFYLCPGKMATMYALVSLLVLFLLFEYLMVEFNKKIPFVYDFIRKKERTHLAGHIFFVIASIIVISVFDKNIVIVCIIMATFGDSVAALVGKKVG